MWWLWWACTQPAPAPTLVEPTADTGTAPVGEAALRFRGAAPTNVLMISIDTLRVDRFTRFGGPGITPFFDAWMASGVVAERHEQCSNWTFASTSCTLHARYPEDVGHMPRLPNDNRTPIPDGQRSLATILGQAGYQTVLVSHNSWLGPEWNNAQGYQQLNPGEGALAGPIIRRAVEAVDPERPWFAHAHLMEPHAPYNPPARFREGEADLPPLPFPIDSQDEHYAAGAQWPQMTADERAVLEQHLWLRYDGEVRWIDEQVEAAIRELSEAGRLDDTLVVVWSDHGEAFWEHGVQTHAHHLYGEENDGLLFFWAKNLDPVVWTEPTHAVDVVPTVLAALGLPVDDDMPGFPVGSAPPNRPRFHSAFARQGVVQAVSRGPYKLIYRWRDGSLELYDRSVDPGEQNNLRRDAPLHPVATELWSVLEPRVRLMRVAVPDRVATTPLWHSSP